MWKLGLGAFVFAVLFAGPRDSVISSSPAMAVAQVADAQPMATCGDFRCEPPEDCHSCSTDCGDCCGNNRCEPPEDCHSCARDCGDCCGNNRCEPPEDCNSCPRDCGNCNR